MSTYPPQQPPVPHQPAWSPVGPSPQPMPPAAMPPPPVAAPALVAAPAPDLTRSYAEWFDWAGTQFGDDHQARVAAEAAVNALRAGADASSAVVAGQQAATAPDAAARPVTADKLTQAYAAWYVWARHKAGLDPQRAHLAAAAGRGAQANGAAVPTAQAHALAAAGVGPAVVTGAAGGGSWLSGISWRDPAFRAIVFGVVCLAAPFFGWVFWILPIIGLVYSIRALTQSRLVYGIIGVVLNGLAALLTGAILLLQYAGR